MTLEKIHNILDQNYKLDYNYNFTTYYGQARDILLKDNEKLLQQCNKLLVFHNSFIEFDKSLYQTILEKRDKFVVEANCICDLRNQQNHKLTKYLLEYDLFNEYFCPINQINATWKFILLSIPADNHIIKVMISGGVYRMISEYIINYIYERLPPQTYNHVIKIVIGLRKLNISDYILCNILKYIKELEWINDKTLKKWINDIKFIFY